MKQIGIVSLTCAVALTVACSRGDVRNESAAAPGNDNSAEVGTSGERIGSSGSSRFVHDLVQAGTVEVEAGTLATQRAASPDVKQFAQMMVKDHTEGGAKLKQIAVRFNLPADATIDEEHGELIGKLSKVPRAEFDREYMKAMVDGHQEVIDKLQSRVDEKNRFATATGQAPKDTKVKPEAADNEVEASLNQWAADTLPRAKQHLERAKAIQEKLDAGRNTTASNR